MSATPFRIAIPDEALDDLRERLLRTRWPSEITDGGWSYGTNQAYLQELCAYWAEEYDWRAHEANLNRHDHFTREVDGFRLHYVQAEGTGPDPLPLVLTHGWPSSFYELDKVIAPLADPAAHGGDPVDAFHVIVPSLPGYGPARTAELWDSLMTDLGYGRYGAHGGDWGRLGGARHRAAGLDVSAARGRHPPHRGGIQGVAEDSSDDEETRKRLRDYWRTEETGYQRIQGTRPQTLAYGLTDSPAGLADWIIEKWRAWSDCGGDLESRFTKDELLTTVALYWFTETIHSSTRFYYESSLFMWLALEGSWVSRSDVDRSYDSGRAHGSFSGFQDAREAGLAAGVEAGAPAGRGASRERGRDGWQRSRLRPGLE